MGKTRTVGIIYGFGEGKWHGKQLIAELQAAGFRIASNVKNADIILTHSGGGIVVPPNRAKLAMLVNPTWPEHSLARCIWKKVSRDFKAYSRHGRIIQWILKTLWNSRYIISRPLEIIRMPRNMYKPEFFTPSPRTVIVRNHHDPWCSSQIAHILENKKGLTFVSFPGEHDDIWINPKPYVDLLQSVYEQA